MNQHTHGNFDHSFQSYRTKPDGSEDPAGEAGWFLQRERERRKVSLRDVARAIRVHPIHLDAIERGDLTRMPHRSDAIGMVGAYAEFLGFDPQPMMMHYAQLLPRSSAPRPQGSRKPEPLGSARIIDFPLSRRLKEIAGGGGGVVASVLAAVVLFGGVSYALLPGDGSDSSQTVAEAPIAGSGDTTSNSTGSKNEVAADVSKAEQSLSDAPAPASKTAEAIDPATDPIGALLAAEADRAADSLGGLDKLIANNGQIETVADNMTTATTTPVKSVDKPVTRDGKGRIFGADNTDARLVLSASERVWVRIEDGKGKTILVDTLNPGDRFKVPNQEGLVVIARDGGLLAFEIDGKPGGTLGNPGEVLVNRTLDINKLLNRGS
ncbi:helix-turn-helix domain-containing protein [Anderseniella sp. Alg231-50]|uniref:helix-turn-helix domain-containing protein n=1 Tax=Anderseniella sp. Alg231-50 TaxID=1922226 RepID=UPI00307C52E9